MAIRTRGAALQIDVQITREGKTARHRETVHGTMDEARAREKDIEAALLRGETPAAIKKLPSADKLTLKAALDATYDRYWANSGQKKHVLSNMKVCVEFFGANKAIGEITTEDADDFILWMKGSIIEGNDATPKDYSPATVKQKVACMTKMLRFYFKRGHIKAMPVFETDPIGDNMRDRVITREEETDFLAQFSTRYDVVRPRRTDGHSGYEFHALFVFLIDTGVRPSEVLKVERANLRGTLLTVKGVSRDSEGKRSRGTKTGKTRTLPLTARAKHAFEQMVALHGDTPFAWATYDTLRHAWDWARGEIGLASDKGFIPYSCRHTCATRLYAKTKNIIVVQQWLGHTEIKMTMRYAKLMPTDLEDARDALEKADVAVLNSDAAVMDRLAKQVEQLIAENARLRAASQPLAA